MDLFFVFVFFWSFWFLCWWCLLITTVRQQRPVLEHIPAQCLPTFGVSVILERHECRLVAICCSGKASIRLRSRKQCFFSPDCSRGWLFDLDDRKSLNNSTSCHRESLNQVTKLTRGKQKTSRPSVIRDQHELCSIFIFTGKSSDARKESGTKSDCCRST